VAHLITARRLLFDIVVCLIPATCKKVVTLRAPRYHRKLRGSRALDCSNLVASNDEFRVEEMAEDPQEYRPGLYYPICIGNILAHRYRIEHKLGHGGFSTVWMARDIRKGKDVALKIMVSGDVGEHELAMQREIVRSVRDTSKFVTYLATFTIPGYFCNHRVLVFPVRGPSLNSCLCERSIATRMSAAKQLLKALECLHRGGIVHRGKLTPVCCSLISVVLISYSTDLNDGSVMWGITSLDSYTTNTKCDSTGS
jgi:protein kinase-like protein